MSHTYAVNLLHCVFSTKNRISLIAEADQPKLCAFIAGITKNEEEFLALLKKCGVNYDPRYVLG
jgi:hypothetical protein